MGGTKLRAVFSIANVTTGIKKWRRRPTASDDDQLEGGTCVKKKKNVESLPYDDFRKQETRFTWHSTQSVEDPHHVREEELGGRERRRMFENQA
jgi:hypothetical protein